MMIHPFAERSSACFAAMLQKMIHPARERSCPRRLAKALLFAFLLLPLFLPRMAAYADFTGSCGTDCDWTLDGEGLLTISGTGPMDNWNSNTIPWYDHRGEIKEVKIEDGITSISTAAFLNCIDLKTVTIPDSVGSIGEFAFYAGKSYKSVTIPDSVTYIGYGAFDMLSSLTILRGDKGLEIGPYAFDINPVTIKIMEGYSVSGFHFTYDGGSNSITKNDDGTFTLNLDNDLCIFEPTDVTLNTYTFTIADTENGSVTASVNGVTVNSGDNVTFKDTVTLTVLPDSGYGLESLTVTKGEETVTVTDDTFIMPAGAVTVAASFKAHEHDYSYSADGAELTAVCANTDRGHVGDSTVVLTLSEPEDLNYDGEAKEASLDGEIPGLDTPEIAYKKGSDALGQAPVDAGTYTAEITLGDATASLEFTIAPKPLSEVTAALVPEGPFPYDGEEHSVKVTARDGEKLLTESIDYEITADSVLKATETGTYEVIVEGVPLTESEEPTVKALSEGNYSGTVTLTWQITDGEPEPDPDPEPEPRRRLFRMCEDCELPATGFSSMSSTALREQPASLRYEPVRMRLMIPTLDQDVELVTIPRQEDSWAVDWLGADAGILAGSAVPGEGTAVIAAHNTLNDTQYGPFAMLASMEPGDRVFVTDEKGELLSFEVYANELLDADDMAAIESLAEENALVLITCENEAVGGGYLNRRAIFAK